MKTILYMLPAFNNLYSFFFKLSEQDKIINNGKPNS